MPENEWMINPSFNNIKDYLKSLKKPITECNDAINLFTALLQLCTDKQGIMSAQHLIEKFLLKEKYLKYEDYTTSRLMKYIIFLDQPFNKDNLVVQAFNQLTTKRVKDGHSLIVTASSNGRTVTFSDDNWPLLLMFALDCGLIDGNNGSLVIRKFEAMLDPKTGYPYKTIYGIFIIDASLTPLPDKSVEKMFSTDGNGNKLEKEKLVRFGSVNDYLPELFKIPSPIKYT
jgi:hypothetical protein